MHTWTESNAQVNGVRLHFVEQGGGPMLMLVHGWPQNWYAWRHLIRPLAKRFRVVVPDLRGYGRSEMAAGGYDKRTMASDLRALAQHLGHSRVSLVGHDRGARVAHRYALDYPEEVERVGFLDIIPTRALFQRMDAALAAAEWHWLFQLQRGLPELLVGTNTAAYLGYFFKAWSHGAAGLGADVEAEYVRAFSTPEALRCGFEDYRATFTHDIPDDEASFAEGRRLTMPALVLWGSTGLMNKMGSALEIWREYALDVRGGPIEACGHFLPEEQPDVVLRHLLAFLG